MRKIIVGGIKGWGGKVSRCLKEGKKIRKTAKDSLEARIRTKLTGKSSWFKKKKGVKKSYYDEDKGAGNTRRKNVGGNNTTPTPTPKTVMFVDQTPGGELAAKLRELFLRLEPTVGFYVKVVEKTGRSLRSMFPLNSLWDGASCGREEGCRTCYQGAEVIPNCTTQSVLYENFCSVCVPGAGKKGEVLSRELEEGNPALYVGETSRSILERTREHWKGYEGKKEDNHIFKQQAIVHGGAPAKFTMRVVGKYKSALCRQVGEAVRIEMRGGAGAILNSKSEYNRCHISRLRVEEEEEVKARAKEQKKAWGQINRELSTEHR